MKNKGAQGNFWIMTQPASQCGQTLIQGLTSANMVIPLKYHVQSLWIKETLWSHKIQSLIDSQSRKDRPPLSRMPEVSQIKSIVTNELKPGKADFKERRNTVRRRRRIFRHEVEVATSPLREDIFYIIEPWIFGRRFHVLRSDVLFDKGICFNREPSFEEVWNLWRFCFRPYPLLLRLGHSYCAFADRTSHLTDGNTVTVRWNLAIV